MRISLEDFEQKGEEINSPRSLKALRECGYVAEDLYVKPLEAFIDKKVEDAELRNNLAQVKFEHIESKRREKLRVVRAARCKIVDRESSSGDTRPASAPQTSSAASSPVKSVKVVDPAREAMLAAEEARMERMRKKQEREMKAILEFETNLVKKKLEHEQKIERDKKRLEERNRKKRARERELIAKKRQIQLEKKRAADEERARIRDRLKEEFEQEKEEAAAIAAEKEAIELERRRRYQKALKEKLEREELKRNRELEEAAKLNEKLDEMEAEAAARKQKLIERKAEEAAAIKEKQERANERIQEALERDAQIQQKIKNDFYKKQRNAQLRKEEKEHEEAVALRKHKEELERKAQRRRNKYREAMGKKAEKIRSFVAQSEEQDERLKAMTKKQRQMRALHNTRRRLELEDRADNVERNARLREYKRLKLLEKIEAEDKRTRDLLRAKEELMEQRRRTAKAVLQQKHELADQMLELQITKKLPGQGKKPKKRKTRKVTRRNNNQPQTRVNNVDDPDFDFEELFSSNFYAT